MTITQTHKCACRTTWLIDDGDGFRPVSSWTAASALFVGLPVKLGSCSTTPMRPLILVGVSYGKSNRYIDEVCPVCGWPTKSVANDPR